MRRLRLVSLLFLALGLFAAGTPAGAHHLATGRGGGVAIPSLAHGQMEVYARHWGEILRLAARNPSADENFRRIVNFARIQKAWCLWGLMPGAISDEESPFNECSHAYLAAARALLEDLREGAPPGSDIDRLGAAVDLDLLMAGVPSVCGFSGEAFDTADHVVPRWGEIGRHPPTSAVFAGGGALVLLAAVLTIRSRIPRFRSK